MSSWDDFVARGQQAAADAATVAQGSGRALPKPVVDALVTLEMDAAVLDIRDIAGLVGSLRHALPRRSEAPTEVSAATAALVRAFEELASSDESGQRYDEAAVSSATTGIEALVATPEAPPPPPPRGGGGAADDDEEWQPTVDADMIPAFLEECQERLEGLGEKLVELERAADDELVGAIFRDLHTLKGSSAFVGLRKMTRLAHAAEDLMGQVRDGQRGVDRPLVDALLGTVDVLTSIIQRANSQGPIDVDVEPAIAALRGTPVTPRAAKADATPTAKKPKTAAPRKEQPLRQQTLRIDFEKLDQLMNLVGELVLAKAGVREGLEGLGGLGREIDAQRRSASAHQRAGHGARSGAVRLQDMATEMSRLQRAFDLLAQDLDGSANQLDFVAGQLRDQVMKLRMVPIGRTWSKYHRTVREIALKVGKQVDLELFGAETELDKVLVELLDDPMLHIVRNAIDHGVEKPDERTKAGKPPAGKLTLEASHLGNQVVIRVEDDGKGIDVDKVRQKAVERGLVDAADAAELSEDDIFDLIFRPGFSTASAVSDLSGRGVGMDVVRDTIAKLKGSVSVSSSPGEGSRFELRLPLTLAIIQVLLVRCAGHSYALPIDLVRRTVSVRADELRVAGGRETLLDGGREVPLLRLRHVLGLGASAADAVTETPVVLVEVRDKTYGLLCDAFLGRQEIVIKSMGSLLKRVPGVAGATILGDRGVLILDVPTLVGMALSGRVAKAASVAPGEPSEQGAKRRILVAEDSDVIRESLKRSLVAAGYEVVAARDGAEAIELAAAAEFDLVSTDVVMPNVDGYELTRRLRRMDGYRDVPIVMVTSKDERIDRIRGFDAGVDEYLTKPADASDLVRIVARLLTR